MASNYMPASTELLDLRTVQEPSCTNTAGRNQEVSLPTELIQHICRIEQRADAAVVECQQDWAVFVMERSCEQLRSGRRFAAKTLFDRQQVVSELDAIQFIHVGISPLEPTQLPAALRHDIMIQQRNCLDIHCDLCRAA